VAASFGIRWRNQRNRQYQEEQERRRLELDRESVLERRQYQLKEEIKKSKEQSKEYQREAELRSAKEDYEYWKPKLAIS